MTYADNPVVADPHRALSAKERDALVSVGFFRRHRKFSKVWLIGPKRFADSTISSLERLDLIKPTRTGELDLTLAGKIVNDKLKGQRT